ncbi:MAG: hypothetical protein WCE63_06230 [Acidobacteriaceae bacterium]
MPEDVPSQSATSAAPSPAKKSATSTAKKASKKSPRKKSPGQKQTRKGRTPRPYPAKTLEEALVIPKAIREQNNGNPWDTEDVAQASLKVAKSNNKFFYTAAAARDYGLTVGTRDTDKIELAPLGRDIFFAPDEETKKAKLLDAFFSIDIFKRVFEHYGSAELPKIEFLTNTLQKDFGLDPEWHEDFVRAFKENCKFLGIEKGLGPTQKMPPTDTPVEHPSEIRVVGQPKGKFDRTAFVIMPFGEKGELARPVGFFSELLNSLITPAANGAGFAVETARKQGSDVIQSTIINQLLKADLVIADLTDHNPNVLFELGIRIAKDLPVALIKAEGTGPIFDVDNMMRVSSYSQNLWRSTVERDVPRLMEHIKGAWDNRSTERSYMTLPA